MESKTDDLTYVLVVHCNEILQQWSAGRAWEL